MRLGNLRQGQKIIYPCVVYQDVEAAEFANSGVDQPRASAGLLTSAFTAVAVPPADRILATNSSARWGLDA